MSALAPPRTGAAFGHPGVAPRWAVSAKDAVGTAYSGSSRVWFTLSLGVLSELYFPTLDHPQTRDFEFLVTDGETFFHEAKRDLATTVEPLSTHALGFRVVSTAPDGRYRLVQDVITDPHQAVVLVHVQLEGDDAAFLDRLRLYALLAPHLDGGRANDGSVVPVADRAVLAATGGETWVTMAATVPFARTSCGFVGASDGWTDLRDNRRMDYAFDRAEGGNIALTGALDLTGGVRTFTLGISFGNDFHSAATALLQALDLPFAQQRDRFIAQWERICADAHDFTSASGDAGRLFHRSHAILLAHEDKTYQGAVIASMSIPWGNAKTTEDLGGYHLVWPRDLYHATTALMALGRAETAVRALIFAACAQLPDGRFPQNFWLDGAPYWKSVQLDGIAYLILLAWRLKEAGALRHFDPYPMVRGAAAALVREGPVTPQERWEEASGLSPSTLAATIAALTCAAAWAEERGEAEAADLFQHVADTLEAHVEAWTVTERGTLVPGVHRHYVRITPTEPGAVPPTTSPDGALLTLANQPPEGPFDYPAHEIVDAGFLELVRLGIRAPGDPLVEASLRVVDAVLKVDTPAGPAWHRYNHDGYGERPDGAPYEEWGVGRAWPLLTGERGHYELAAGRDVRPYIAALEGLASANGLLPEQVWDEADRPEAHLFLGAPTGAAMPLVWAHAEYVKLLCSACDGAVFDRVDVVADRYLGAHRPSPKALWSFHWQVDRVRAGSTLRILAQAPFTLRWSFAGQTRARETPSTDAGLGLSFADVSVPTRARTLTFTFYWPEADRWEGRSFTLAVTPSPRATAPRRAAGPATGRRS